MSAGTLQFGDGGFFGRLPATSSTTPTACHQSSPRYTLRSSSPAPAPCPLSTASALIRSMSSLTRRDQVNVWRSRCRTARSPGPALLTFDQRRIHRRHRHPADRLSITWRHAVARQFDRHHHGPRQPRVRSRQHLPGRGRRHDGGPHQRHRHRDPCRHDPGAVRLRGRPRAATPSCRPPAVRNGTFTARRRDRSSRPRSTPALSYTATYVLLTLTVRPRSSAAASTRNQRAFGTVLDICVQCWRARSAPASSRCSICPAPALSGALTQLSGEVATGAAVWCHAADELVPLLDAQSVRRRGAGAGVRSGASFGRRAAVAAR